MNFRYMFGSSHLMKGKCECSESPHFYSIISTIHHSDEVRTSSKIVWKRYQILKPLPIPFRRAFCHHFASILGPLSLPRTPLRRSKTRPKRLKSAPRHPQRCILVVSGGSWGVLGRPWAVLERSAPFAGSLQGVWEPMFNEILMFFSYRFSKNSSMFFIEICRNFKWIFIIFSLMFT